MDNKEMANKIIDEICELDPKYIDEATGKVKRVSKRKIVERVVTFGAMAACIGLVITGISRFSGMVKKPDESQPQTQTTPLHATNKPEKDDIIIEQSMSLAIGGVEDLYEMCDFVVEATVVEEMKDKKRENPDPDDYLSQYLESEFFKLEVGERYKGDVLDTIYFENKYVKDGYFIEDFPEIDMKEGDKFIMFLTYDYETNSYALIQQMVGAVKLNDYKVDAGYNYVFNDCTHINDVKRMIYEYHTEFSCLGFYDELGEMDHVCVKVLEYENRVIRAVAMENSRIETENAVHKGDIVEFSYDDIFTQEYVFSEYPFSPEEYEDKGGFRFGLPNKGDYIALEINSTELTDEGIHKMTLHSGKIQTLEGEVLEIDNEAGSLIMLRNGIETEVRFSPDTVNYIANVSYGNKDLSSRGLLKGDRIAVKTLVYDGDIYYASGVECFILYNEIHTDIECEIIASSNVMCEKPVKSGKYPNTEDWHKAVKASDIQDLKDALNRYNEVYFENNDLFFYTKVSSAGVEYKFVDYGIEEVDGKKVLNIYVEASYEYAMNHLGAYYFLVRVAEDLAEGVEDIDVIVRE